MSNEKQFDVCIAGSGPAGAFAAHYLAEAGYHVALVEAGGDEINPDPDNFLDLEKCEISGEIDFGFSQQVGGSSNLWAGGLARFYPIDLIKRQEFGFEGWPIGNQELQSLYRKVDGILGIDDKHFEESQNNLALRQMTETSSLELREMLMLNTPYTTKRLVENHPGIYLFKHSPACGFTLSPQQDRVSSLQVFDSQSKQVSSIHADHFILASGALNNVRLLLASLEPLKRQKPKFYEGIGKYFSTHPKGNIGTLKLRKPLGANHPFFVFQKFGAYRRRFQFGLNERTLSKYNLLNHCLRFDSSLNRLLTTVFDRFRHFLGKISLVGKGNGFLTQALVKLGIVIYRAIDAVCFFGLVQRNVAVRIFLDQESRRENRIGISTRKSASGLPLATIHWSFSDKDWSNAEKFVGVFREELRALNIGELEYRRCVGSDFIGIHSHFLGGTRMGENSEESVVDKNLQVHGISNLYVSGPSVFPSFGYTNPFYTIAAMSMRLGEFLKQKMESERRGVEWRKSS